MIPAKPDHSLFSSSAIKEKKGFVSHCSGRNILFSARAAKNPPPPPELDVFWDLWEENPQKSLPEPASPLGTRIAKTCFQHLRALAISTASVFSKSLDPTNTKSDTFLTSLHQKSFPQAAVHQNQGQFLGAETLGEDSPNRIAVAEARDPSHTLTPHIRGAKALNVLDVIRHFDYQTQPIQPAEISTLVFHTTQKFPRHTPQEVLEALGRMTQFSQLSDLNGVVGFLQDQETSGKFLHCDGLPTSLSSVIGYLREKGNYTMLSLLTRCLNVSSYYADKGYFLLDIPLLEALKEDPKAVEATHLDDIQFLIPEGYSTGMGPLTHTTLSQLEKKLHQLLTLADGLQE
ncbi:MAG: hypothetical protein K2X66_14515, partial [Cyanobacteria bacterium]|nr:hypothetical protein [Cyanobacteriota bacterium]